MSNEIIKRFVDRVRQQARTQSKVYNMPMNEAQDLANSLALVLLRENELLQEISELKSAASNIEVIIGGGSFR